MSEERPLDQIMIPCSCAAQCELAMITYMEELDPLHPEFFLEWYVTLSNDAPFSERLTQAWKMLCKKDHWIHNILVRRSDAKRLAEWLTEKTKEKDVQTEEA